MTTIIARSEVQTLPVILLVWFLSLEKLFYGGFPSLNAMLEEKDAASVALVTLKQV